MTTWTFHARVVAHKGWGLFRNYQPENNYKDRHGLHMWLLWSLRIIAFKLYFALARMSLRDFFLFANRRQVLLACISKVWDLIRREGWEWRNSLNLCESPDEFFSCLRISRRLWKYGAKNQKHTLHKDSNVSKQQKNELIKISMPAACSRVFIPCTLIK